MPSVTELLKEKAARLAELRQETAQLEAELAEAKAFLSGRPRPSGRGKSRHGFTGGVRKRPIQPNSSVDWARRILDGEGKPLGVDEIIGRIAAEGGPTVKKPTLVSNLSRYVKHRDTFERTGRNTYGLVEWDREQPDELFGNPDTDVH